MVLFEGSGHMGKELVVWHQFTCLCLRLFVKYCI